MPATLDTAPVRTRLDRADSAPQPDLELDDQPVRAPRPLIPIDAGWFFLIAGIGLLAATIVIPAQHDLGLIRWQRDRALAIEHHRMDRLERYGTYLAALEKGDETVLLSLAASQLNKSPADRIPLATRPDTALTSASVFPELEPGPVKLPDKPAVTDRSSLLARWTINDRSRIWLLAAGMLCIMVGVLPPSMRK